MAASETWHVGRGKPVIVPQPLRVGVAVGTRRETRDARRETAGGSVGRMEPPRPATARHLCDARQRGVDVHGGIARTVSKARANMRLE